MQDYITQLEAACKEYKELQRLREELEAEMEATAAQIKEIMGDRETVTAGPFKASNKLVNSSRLDSKGLKAAFPDLVARFTKATQYRRFTVQ